MKTDHSTTSSRPRAPSPSTSASPAAAPSARPVQADLVPAAPSGYRLFGELQVATGRTNARARVSLEGAMQLKNARRDRIRDRKGPAAVPFEEFLMKGREEFGVVGTRRTGFLGLLGQKESLDIGHNKSLETFLAHGPGPTTIHEWQQQPGGGHRIDIPAGGVSISADKLFGRGTFDSRQQSSYVGLADGLTTPLTRKTPTGHDYTYKADSQLLVFASPVDGMDANVPNWVKGIYSDDQHNAIHNRKFGPGDFEVLGARTPAASFFDTSQTWSDEKGNELRPAGGQVWTFEGTDHEFRHYYVPDGAQVRFDLTPNGVVDFDSLQLSSGGIRIHQQTTA